MTNIYLTPEAEEDLKKILQYTFSTWGIIQPDLYQDELFHAMELISKDHDLGKRYILAVKDYRKIHINRHLIFYRNVDDNCIVIRILHDRMNLRDYLQ